MLGDDLIIPETTMKFRKIISIGLSMMFALSLCSNFKINAENTNESFDCYTILDANSIEYQNWKAEIADSKNTKKIATYVLKKNSNGISNDYLALNFYNERFTLGTIGGDPNLNTDNNQKLLYGYPDSGTSYTTIRIDNEDYVFQPDNITFVGNVVTASQIYDNVIINLHFSFINNQYTGRDDIVEYSYTLENTDKEDHTVGVRIMLDTMLGDNDRSPFRIPGIGDTSRETDLSGDDVPEYWQSFNRLPNPTVISQGTLKVEHSSTPDRVRFTNWGMAFQNKWDYIRKSETENGDSAVCLYWNPKSISNGDKITCKTYYGLSSLQQDGTPPLAVALSGASRLEVSHNGTGDVYTPNPFTVTAYIQNIGDGIARNVKARLNIPDNMSIVGDESIVELGSLDINSKQYQVSWNVWVEPSSENKTSSYSVTVMSDNADTKTIQRNIYIPQLQENGPLKLYLRRNIINDESNRLHLNFKIENSSNDNININDYKVRYYFIDESPNSKKLIDKYYCGNIYGNNIPVNITYHKLSAPFKNQANAYLEFDFLDSSTILNDNDYIIVNCGVYTNDYCTMLNTNDFSVINNNYRGEDGFVLWTKMPIYEINSTKRIWGSEPKDNNNDVSPKLTIYCLANTINEDSIVNMVLNIKNNSSTPVELSKSILEYYYTNDNEYRQKVNVNYVGGRINGSWKQITDKVNASADLLEIKKDRANSVVKLNFDNIAETLCYNESIDIHLQIYNEDWKQGKFNLSNDYSFDGLSDNNHIANNIIYLAHYLNSLGNYAEYQYGTSIGKYKPTYSAFKIGNGNSEENKIDDFNNFIDYFTSDFNGVKYNEFAVGENISHEFIFTKENLQALLASDIAYISGHGSRGGAIPIYKNGIKPENILVTEAERMYEQILSTDKNIGIDFQDFAYFEINEELDPDKIFSINMKDHQNENIEENLQWIITAACSQISDDNVCNIHRPDGHNDKKNLDKNSVERWINVLAHNKNLKGILGYWNVGLSASDSKTDSEVIYDFLLYSFKDDSNNPSSIYDAWLEANSTNFGLKTAPCGILVKDEYDKESLPDSLESNKKVEFNNIYRYTAVCREFIGVDINEEVVFSNAINAIASYYGVNSDIIREQISSDYMEIEKITYDEYGNYLRKEIEDCLFEIEEPKTSSSYLFKSSKQNAKIIKYNIKSNSVSEFNYSERQ